MNKTANMRLSQGYRLGVISQYRQPVIKYPCTQKVTHQKKSAIFKRTVETTILTILPTIIKVCIPNKCQCFCKVSPLLIYLSVGTETHYLFSQHIMFVISNKSINWFNGLRLSTTDLSQSSCKPVMFLFSKPVLCLCASFPEITRCVYLMSCFVYYVTCLKNTNKGL